MKKRLNLMPAEDLSLQEGFEKFIQLKRAVNLSQATLEGYASSFRYFADFTGADINCKTISNNTVLEYISYLRRTRPNLANTSLNAYLRGLRAILYFLMRGGYMPKFEVSMIRAEKKIKEVYTDEELEKLLKKPNIKTSNFSEYRNWVIVCYLLGTGNRLATVCNIKIGDINFAEREIKLKSVKNKKQYIIPLSATLEKTLLEYLVYRKGNAADYLFCSTYGEQLDKEALKTAVRRYNQRRGVNKTGIHAFRHTYGKDWIKNRGDMFSLQKLLGHSSLEMVKEYVEMFAEDLKQDYDRFNPLDKRTGYIDSRKSIKLV
ncbi:MAG: tyrosine-type recombinase/integrase [Clostridiales bacterium]|nr:tyrosine-type recombinase/integrase [Clostridiales bacterium]